MTDGPGSKRKDETPLKKSKKRGSSSSKKTSSSYEFDNIELSKPFNVEKRGNINLY